MYGKPDLENRDEISKMVNAFYTRVQQDPRLGPLFDDVAKVDWPPHMEKLTNFWSRILLGQAGYAGNPMRAHVDVHVQSEFDHDHFRRWLTLFHDTIDTGWAGPLAEHAKMMGRRVAAVHSGQLTGEKYIFDPSDRTIPVGMPAAGGS